MSTQKLGTVPEVMAKNAHADILTLSLAQSLGTQGNFS